MKILSFGEIIWDVYPDKRVIGGAPLNFAAHAHRAGADADMISAVGKDDIGNEALAIITRYGIGTKHVSVSDAPTGQCIVTLDQDGVPSYNVLTDTAYDMIRLPDTVDEYDALAFGTLALRGENNRKVLKKMLDSGGFKEIFVDINLRAPFYSDEIVNFAFQYSTIAKISEEELPTVMRLLGVQYEGIDQSAGTLFQMYPNIKIAIITCGGDPSHTFDFVHGQKYTCDAEKTTVVSTVGAGDSYGATFLVNYLFGSSIPDCMRRAAKVSAYVISHTEAIPE